MDRPRDRELVFCHQCENEWYRDEHGLVCPTCESEFTEIIEEDHDPRADQAGAEDDDEADGAAHQEPPLPHPLHYHNPWSNAPDPDEGDIDRFEWRSNGPGSFTISGTVYRNVGGPGQRQPQPPVFENPVFQNFATMLQGIAGQTYRPPGQQNGGPGNQGASGSGVVRSRPGGGPRFTYSSSARLYPRDANNPQPRLEPVDDLQSIIGQIFGAPNAPNGNPAQNAQPGRGQGPPPNPLAAFFSAILNPAAAAHGDAVYTQEALDRVISQLMEQNVSGNAPGPASPEAIAALPKKAVDIDMLGDNGRAECSICMDEVEIGEKVTALPCSHWFHGTCIEAWLKEHDTCPHCRQGITTQSNEQTNANVVPNGDTAPSRPQPDANSRQYQPPGAFTYGNNTSSGPFEGNGARPAFDRRHRPERYPSSGGRSGTDSNGNGNGASDSGIGGTLRNLFRGGSRSDRS